MPTIRLPSEACALEIDADGLAMQVHLTPHEVAQLWAGVALNVADGAVRRLALSLGVEQAALLVSGAATANDAGRGAANEDCDAVGARGRGRTQERREDGPRDPGEDGTSRGGEGREEASAGVRW